MTVAITCNGCNRPLRVADKLIGQTVRCPLCVEIFVAEPAPDQGLAAPPPPVTTRDRSPQASSLQSGPNGLALAEVQVAEQPAGGLLAVPAVETRSFKPISLGVEFIHDPDRLFRGRAEAELTSDGLRLRLRSRRDFWVPARGSQPARYIGANRIVLFLDGREVTIALTKQCTDLNHLAANVTAFLNGERTGLDLADYRLPRLLALMPWLALAIPFIAIWLKLPGGVSGGGRFLWFLLAALAVFFGFRWMRRAALSTGAR